MTHTPAKSTQATIWLLATTILWGGSFVFNKIGFSEIPPATFMFYRFALATLLMGMYCIPRLGGMRWTIVRKGSIVGIALAAANLSFVLGVNGTTVSRAAFLNNLFVLLVPLVCFLIWRESVSRLNLLGVGLAVVGLWQLAQGGTEGFNRGDLLSTICAFFIALHIITVSKVLRDDDVYLVSLVQFATVAVVGFLLFLFYPPPTLQFGPVAAGALIYCAVFPTVVCFTLQNTWQRYTTPTQAGLIYTLDPVWSMLGGFLILGERLTMREWLGCGLIFGAVVVPLLARFMRERWLLRTYRGANQQE